MCCMTADLPLLTQLAVEVEKFPLGNCGPSDDPDKQTAYLYDFRELSKRFVSTAKRSGDSRLLDMVSKLNTSPEYITEAYDLRAELLTIVDYLREGKSQKSSMKKIARHNLIGQIAYDLQARMNTSGINVFLGGFGVEHENVDIVPSKRVYVEKLLSRVSDTVVLEIARELDITTPNSEVISATALGDYLNDGGYRAAMHDFERALTFVESDPEQALGSASSTLESICKAILDHFKEMYPKDQSLQPLMKSVFDKMELSPEGHADPDIKRVLGGLSNAAVGVGVLRTKFSGFHGKGNEQKRNRLTSRHAKLAVNASITVGLFLIETYSERFSDKEDG